MTSGNAWVIEILDNGRNFGQMGSRFVPQEEIAAMHNVAVRLANPRPGARTKIIVDMQVTTDLPAEGTLELLAP